MEKDLISIIIPVYNAEKYLDRCIESVVNQTYKKLEIILVDDGSPDNCPQICDFWSKKDNRIKVVHQKNAGVSVARNNGLNIATGEFVAFIDSDDYIANNYYEIMIKNAKLEDFDLVISGFTIIENGKQKVTCKDKLEIISLAQIEDFCKLIDDGYFNSPWNKLYKRELISEKFKEGLPLCEDKIFNFNYFKKINKVAVIPNAGYNYIIYPNSAYHKTRKNFYNILVVSIDEHAAYLDFKYGTHNNNNFYKTVADFAVYTIIKCTKDEKKQTFKQLKNYKIFKECLKNYKPKTFKEKIKLLLLRLKLFSLIRLILS